MNEEALQKQNKQQEKKRNLIHLVTNMNKSVNYNSIIINMRVPGRQFEVLEQKISPVSFIERDNNPKYTRFKIYPN